MKYSVLSLFPQLIQAWFEEGLLAKARQQGLIEVDLRSLRDYGLGKHRNVDDTPYGGGAGMVIRVDVAAAAIRDLEQPDEIILLSPAGKPFDQKMAEELASKNHLALLCGRYEGFDARVEQLVSREVSIGDYVLMGGEVAALALIEATARLLPGVLGDAASHQQDSFSTGLLDYPEYTRPADFEGVTIPEVLLSGHHAMIHSWRHEQALARTKARRPELLDKLKQSIDQKQDPSESE